MASPSPRPPTCILPYMLLTMCLLVPLYIIINTWEPPIFTIDRFFIEGSNNLTSPSTSHFHHVEIHVSATNPNTRHSLSVHPWSPPNTSTTPGNVAVYYASTAPLCMGLVPGFHVAAHGGTRVVVVVRVMMEVADEVLVAAMEEEETELGRHHSLEVYFVIPFSVRLLGWVESGVYVEKVRCEVVVDKLSSDSRVVWESCSYVMR